MAGPSRTTSGGTRGADDAMTSVDLGGGGATTSAASALPESAQLNNPAVPPASLTSTSKTVGTGGRGLHSLTS